ncbi:ME53 [Perigonia lusca single nucleopolyhedrovirus]|uniref:ME53 n=1 Tax=Perigonia lusca single nucleopolyhedrovirus TaxID=1675865 RepID=A0A0M3WNX2_9ABAC|nr:ME53 [Perigonia lusca single nucleopolyhedrovirus]AKN80620.1 ME53 [Perigonia lusca single nucleopolyhedrovirus]
MFKKQPLLVEEPENDVVKELSLKLQLLQTVGNRDVRDRFISHENVRLMQAIMVFAYDYVRGIAKINNLHLMSCDDLKSKELMTTTNCDKCKGKFVGYKLFLLVNTKIIETTAVNCHNKFKFLCEKCYLQLKDDADYSFCQLFPKITFQTMETLCADRFITKYIFNINPYDYKNTRMVYKDTIHDVRKSLNQIVANKLPHEQITKVIMRTYEKALYEETYEDFSIDYKLNFEFDKSSGLDTFVNQHVFKNLTYFYEVQKRVYTNEKSYNYIAFFAKPFFGYNKRASCVKCKDKFLNKRHIILYCSNCGFVNRLHFQMDKDGIDVNKIEFIENCVLAVRTKLSCLIYYDFNMYEKEIQ